MHREIDIKVRIDRIYESWKIYNLTHISGDSRYKDLTQELEYNTQRMKRSGKRKKKHKGKTYNVYIT